MQGGGGKRACTHCSHMRQVPLVTCILLCYTKIMGSISVYPLKGCTTCYTPCETHMGGFEVKNDIALTVTVCIALFKAISELQKDITCCSV